MPSKHQLLSTHPSKLMPGRNTTLRTSSKSPSWMHKLLKGKAFQKGAKMRNGYGFRGLNHGA